MQRTLVWSPVWEDATGNLSHAAATTEASEPARTWKQEKSPQWEACAPPLDSAKC